MELARDNVPTGLGRYSLLGKLAQGGMAELFLAKASGIQGFEKVVALKRILPNFAADEEFIELFLSEARLAAQLDHPNIVHVHDIGRDGDEFFFTMEYLHGHNLRRLLKEASRRGEALPLEAVLTIVSGVASGLHHAHEQVDFEGKPLGIVHRDVSPSNVLVIYGGGVKLVDFGIAKAAALSRASKASTLKGKAAYMSPEQCRGSSQIDRRSDIFALGLILQELLTNVPVFGGMGDASALLAIAAGDVVPIRELWPECPPELAEVVAKALQPDPDDRYATALDLQRDIETFALDARVLLSNAALGSFLEEWCGTKRYPWLDAPEPAANAMPETVAKGMPAGGVSEGTRPYFTGAFAETMPQREADPVLLGAPAVDMGFETPTAALEGDTSVALEPAELPRPKRRWPWAAGLLGVLGLGATVATIATMRGVASDDAAHVVGEEEESKAVPLADDEPTDVEVPAPDDAATADAAEPSVEEPPARGEQADVAEPVEPEQTPDETPPAADDPGASEAKPKRAKKPSRKDRRGRRGRGSQSKPATKPPKKSPAAKPAAKPKPAADPDAMLPN